MHHATCIAGSRLRFGMLTALWNLRSTKVLWKWKTTFSGRRPLVEDNLCWKITFGGRWPSVENNFWLKTTFCGREPVVEDNLDFISFYVILLYFFILSYSILLWFFFVSYYCQAQFQSSPSPVQLELSTALILIISTPTHPTNPG